MGKKSLNNSKSRNILIIIIAVIFILAVLFILDQTKIVKFEPVESSGSGCETGTTACSEYPKCCDDSKEKCATFKIRIDVGNGVQEGTSYMCKSICGKGYNLDKSKECSGSGDFSGDFTCCEENQGCGISSEIPGKPICVDAPQPCDNSLPCKKVHDPVQYDEQGNCIYDNLADGTRPCDLNHGKKPSNYNGVCIGGSCVSDWPPCPPSANPCRGEGTRDQNTGVCSYPPVADGTECNTNFPATGPNDGKCANGQCIANS